VGVASDFFSGYTESWPVLSTAWSLTGSRKVILIQNFLPAAMLWRLSWSAHPAPTAGWLRVKRHGN
jgi:hypothetical protein